MQDEEEYRGVFSSGSDDNTRMQDEVKNVEEHRDILRMQDEEEY